MLNIKSVIAAAVLSGIALVSFAQAPAGVKSAPANDNMAAPMVATPDAGTTAKPATKHMAKKVKHTKTVKHMKAKKAVKPAAAASN